MKGDKDLDRELEAHLELDAEDRREDGAEEEEALNAARRELGDATQIKETVYEMHPLAWVERWWKDLRCAARSLRRNPGFASVAVVSLALGIGAATAIFTIADRALLRALPVENPGELRVVNWQGEFIGGSSHLWSESFSYPAFRELEEARPASLSGMAARFQANAAIDAGSGVSRAVVEIVSGTYFDVLGVKATTGRTLSPDDDEDRDAEPWVVLTHNYWRDRLGADDDVVGRTVRLNGFPMTVIGVAQPGFRGFNKLRPADVFVPFQMNGVIVPTNDLRDRRDAIWLNVFARLAPGADPREFESVTQVSYGETLRKDLAAHSRSENKSQRYLQNSLVLVDGSQGLDFVAQFIATPLHLLLAMAGLLLLIACTNVATLLMIRASKREKEIALRCSLGASRQAVMRLVLMESLLLAGVGCVLGLVVARFGAEFLVRMAPPEWFSVRLDDGFDWRVVGFSTGLAVLTALVFGLVPALQSTRSAAATALKAQAASVSLGRSQTRARQTMIVAQVAFSLMLLAVAGLFGKSLSAMFGADTGFAVDRLLAFSINPSEHGYDSVRTHRFALDLQRRLALLPGVDAASAASVPILAGGGPENTIAAEGYEPGQGEDMQAYANHVLPGFFSTTGVGLLAGRDFVERDVLDGPQVVIVNEAFAVRFFGSPTEAIGRHAGFGLGRVLPFEVVGVVANHKGRDMREDAFPRTYWPLLQQEHPDHMAFYLRTRGNPESLLAGAIGAVRELDPELAVFHPKTVEQQLHETHFIERIFAQLSATFAALATLIAAIGLYGVAAFSVARRTREIGIRVALGALRGGVFRMVLREALTLAVLGVLIGLPLALCVGKLVEAQLYGVPAIDPVVTIAAAAALLAAAVLAGYLPARKAMQISPVQALRHD